MNRSRIVAATLAIALVAATHAVAQGPAARQRPKPLPLDAARKAEFTATQGTWISLDVSPDGQTIV